jgi:hypothetical protein
VRLSILVKTLLLTSEPRNWSGGPVTCHASGRSQARNAKGGGQVYGELSSEHTEIGGEKNIPFRIGDSGGVRMDLYLAGKPLQPQSISKPLCAPRRRIRKEVQYATRKKTSVGACE